MRSLTKYWSTEIFLGLTLLCIGILLRTPAAVAACTQTTDYGNVIFDTAHSNAVTIPTSGTYRVWSRMQIPSSSNDNYLLEIDGTCYTVGDNSSVTPNTWTWIDYKTGGSKIDVALSAGTHTLKMYGTSDGVLLDRVIFTTDTACVPDNATPVVGGKQPGDNCAVITANVAPAVTMTASPTSGTAPLAVTLTATATDSDGTVSQVQFFNGSSAVGTGTKSGNTYSLTLTGLAAGTYNYTAKATDNDGAITQSTPAKTVTVSAVTNKPGDANGDGVVGIADLNALSFNYGKTGMTFAQGDFNGDGAVGIVDLNILSGNWGK